LGVNHSEKFQVTACLPKASKLLVIVGVVLLQPDLSTNQLHQSTKISDWKENTLLKL